MRIWLLIILIGSAIGAEPPAPTFAKKPTAKREGSAVAIDFSVSRETDVCVAIEDAKGKVVRHLVAGQLGKNPPAPLKANSLAQNIKWDLKDDAGKPAAGGPFKIRVGLGLTPQLEEYMFDHPEEIGGEDHSLGVDKKGNLYLSANPGGVFTWNAPGGLVRVFDRSGKYVKTITPYAANIPVDKLKGAGAFVKDGHLFPVFHEIMNMRMLPGREGCIGGYEMFTTSNGRLYKLIGPGCWALRPIGTDGSMPAEMGISPVFFPSIQMSPAAPRPFIACSSDEKWAYMSQMSTKGNGQDGNGWYHAVYRAPLDGKSEAKIFVGSQDEAGSDDKHLNHPTGICSDGNGLLFVSDCDNNRIQVFKESDASFVTTIKVDAPGSIQVHPKTGAIYVVAANGGCLLKLKSSKEPAEVCRLNFDGYSYKVQNWRYPPLVLDGSAEPAILYMSGVHRSLARIEDKGAALEEKIIKPTQASCGSAEDLSVDRERDELYVKPGGESFMRVDIKTGNAVGLGYQYMGGTAGTQIAVTPEGDYITLAVASNCFLNKWDRDFKPKNFSALGKNRIEINNFMSFASRGLTVAANGDIYVMPVDRNEGYGWGRLTEVQIYNPDGTKKSTVIWRLSESATGPRVDRQGNIYVAENFKAKDQAIPDFFKGVLPDYTEKLWRNRWEFSNPVGQLAWTYGGLIKFPPSGGAVWYTPDCAPGQPGLSTETAKIPDSITKLPKTVVSQMRSNGHMDPLEVQGALWTVFGYSAIADKLGGGYDCNCQGTRFDVDDYGRVYFPDIFRFRIGVLDTNGNEFCSIGHYGNRDSGPKSLIPDTAAAFAYPYTVAASYTHLFVGDLLNNRIAKLKLAYAAEETCAAP